MKRFVIKFYAFFGIIFGLIGFYALNIKPQISGDIGMIGKIPFGQEYDERMESPYKDIPMKVRTKGIEDVIVDSVVTIGDSFSQFGRLGYSNFLANELQIVITNILKEPYSPEQTFVDMLNSRLIPRGSIVLVESVERSCIERLISVDFTNTCVVSGIKKAKEQKSNLLDETIIWFRTNCGMKNPVQIYHTERDLFSHPTRHNELYVYDSKWSQDGDLRFVKKLREPELERAWKNLYRLHKYAEEQGVTLLYMIAADKYDVYEPFIMEEHLKNPTLDACPDESWIINTKPLLQARIRGGEQDVYSINNTHWSPKGAEIVGHEAVKRLISTAK